MKKEYREMKIKELKERMATIKSNGDNWMEYAKLTQEICEDWQYARICLDDDLCSLCSEMRQMVDAYVYNELSEDDACEYHDSLD